jgi:hypothetical protein
MVRIYEVPFHPHAGRAWEVRVAGRVIERCDSRYDALRCAVSMASSDGGDARIDVEGADGVWRPFGTDIKRPVAIPMPARRASVSVPH